MPNLLLSLMRDLVLEFGAGIWFRSDFDLAKAWSGFAGQRLKSGS